MTRTSVALLQIIFAVLGLGAVLAQVTIPFIAADFGRQYPEVAHLVVLYSVLAIAAIVCAEVMLFATSRLLVMVARGALFTDAALRWVDTFVAFAAVATALCAFVWVHLIVIEETGGPGELLLIGALALVGLAVAVLMTVLRGVLKSATTNHRDLAGVI